MSPPNKLKTHNRSNIHAKTSELTFFAYREFGRLNHIAKIDYIKAQAASDSLAEALDICRNVAMIIAIEDTDFRNKSKESIEAARVRYRAAMKTIEEMEKSNEGKVLVEKMKT